MSFVGTFGLVTESSKPGEIKAIGTRGDLIRGAWETMCNLCVFFIQVENSSHAVNFHSLRKSEERAWGNKPIEYSNSNSSKDCRKKLFKQKEAF